MSRKLISKKYRKMSAEKERIKDIFLDGKRPFSQTILSANLILNPLQGNAEGITGAPLRTGGKTRNEHEPEKNPQLRQNPQ